MAAVTEPSVVARRLAAELELERSVNALLIHELGSPLQSLLILIELCRDELGELVADPGSGVNQPGERLDRALHSVERLRQILLASSRVRASVVDGQQAEQARRDPWGQLLDELLEFVGQRLTQLRAGLVRFTDEIDRRAVAPGYVRVATLGLLVGACRQIADGRGDGTTLELLGSVLDGQTCLRVTIHDLAGPVEFAPQVVAQVVALLGDDAHSRCERDGRSLLIRSA
jgi:hypothetical protein